jgi:hypothetical protein
MTVLDLSDEEIVAAVEAEAAVGDSRARSCCAGCSRSSEREGRLTVIAKLACKPHVDG